MDSCVCAALAARDYHAAAVHVSYGQRTELRERRAFEAICDRLGIRDRLVVRNEALRAIGGSALTDASIAVPESHGIESQSIESQSIEPTGAGDSRHVCALPQRAFSVRRRELGGSFGGDKNLYWSGRAGQFGLSRLPPGILQRVQ